MKTVTFENHDADIVTLGSVCRDLESRGIPPNDAAAYVLADMANQAIMKGIDPTQAVQALHQVISGNYSKPEEKKPEVNNHPGALTERQVEEIRSQVKFLQNFLLYWDMILCSEIQRYTFEVLDELKSKGMYRHELKQYANKLEAEGRRLQMRIKDNDRVIVLKWCRRTDGSSTFAHRFFEDGESIVSRFVLAYQKRFKTLWDVVRLDCRNAAKHLKTQQPSIVATLLEIEALTNTGIELFDVCVRKMKQLVLGHGKTSIVKSTHHESMRNATHNLLRRLVAGSLSIPETETRYARQHLADMQKAMSEEGQGDFFQQQFDFMTEDFARYIPACIRLGMECGRAGFGAVRYIYYRLGTRHRVEKFFSQLRDIPLDDDGADVYDVMDAIAGYNGKKTEVDRLVRMCIKDERHELPDSEDKQEARLLRQQARRNGGILPDGMLRVMVGYYKTKKSLVEHLSSVGFELGPTLKKVNGMKASELKQL